MSDLDDALQEARDAYARRNWPDAYQGLKRVLGQQQLSTDDLHALGDAAWWLGLIRETLAVSEQCYQRFLAEGRVDRAATTALDVGFAWLLRGEPTIGSAWVSRARRLLADQPEGEDHGFLRWLDLDELLGRGALDDALAVVREVQAVAERVGSPGLEALGLLGEGTIAIRSGDLERGFALLDEAMLPVLAGDLRPEQAGMVYCQTIALCCELADLARARHWTAVTERWCQELSGAAMFLGICRLHRVQLLRLGGDWTGADDEVRTACTELAEMNVSIVAEAHYELGELRRLRGDHDAAAAAYQRAGELGREPEPGRALLHLAAGDPTAARSSAQRAVAEADTSGAVFRKAPLLAALVEIAIAAGDTPTAEEAAAELGSIAERYPTPGFGAAATLARGRVLLHRGEHEPAAAVLRDAVARYRDLGAPYDAARGRTLLAEALLALGDTTAPAQLDAAEQTFAGLGAGPDLRRVGQLRQPPPVPGGLTARELEVLRRVASGLTNKDVAAALRISDRTVARHLANIYVKLGLSTRTAAAAWAIDHGLVRPGDPPAPDRGVGDAARAARGPRPSA